MLGPRGQYRRAQQYSLLLSLCFSVGDGRRMPDEQHRDTQPEAGYLLCKIGNILSSICPLIYIFFQRHNIQNEQQKQNSAVHKGNPSPHTYINKHEKQKKEKRMTNIHKKHTCIWFISQLYKNSELPPYYLEWMTLTRVC